MLNSRGGNRHGRQRESVTKTAIVTLTVGFAVLVGCTPATTQTTSHQSRGPVSISEPSREPAAANPSISGAPSTNPSGLLPTQPSSGPADGEAPTAPTATTTKPNVVIILADDLRKGVAEGVLKETNQYVTSRGTQFTNAVVTTPHCCPSRSMLLTGRYAHTTGIWDNGEVAGGWKPFHNKGLENETLAVALDAEGYRTGLFGKYLNGYNRHSEIPKPVPTGWDVFETFTNIGATGAYYNYSLTGVGAFGDAPSDYSTDVLAGRATKFIRESSPDEPVFLMVTPYAPHSPTIPPPRYAVPPDARNPIPSQRFSAAGKPRWVQAAAASRTQNFFDKASERRAREVATMRAFDDAVGKIARALERAGRLDNTIFIVTSDNGYLHGDYGLGGKNLPYRAVTDVPLAIAWPTGSTLPRSDSRLITMVDIPTSITKTVGATMKTEGINIFNPDNERSGTMLEGTSTDPARPAYCGYRTLKYRFARYSDGSEELYSLDQDPHEMRNLVTKPKHQTRLSRIREKARNACQPTAPGFSWKNTKPTNSDALKKDESSTEE